MDAILSAMRAQLDELASLLAPLSEAGWASPSTCAGWTVRHVVLHLAQTNELAAASASGDLERVTAGWGRAEGTTVDDLAAAAVTRDDDLGTAEVYQRWRQSADAMVDALAGGDPRRRVTWVAGDMAARTLATTRLAETWIHTGDVAWGLGVDLPGTDRIWHIARLAHRTLPYAFARAGEEPPGPVRFELTAPDGDELWTFGVEDAPTVVTGPALDLCRVAGQRASATETALLGTGPDADGVLTLARTFA